jgi:hypothetical protein
MANNILKYKIDTDQQTRAQICAKIAQIDVMILSLYSTALKSVANGDVAEYEIDTGQTKQKVKYTSTSSVYNAINGYEMLREKLQAKLSPRVVRLMDGKNFRR